MINYRTSYLFVFISIISLLLISPSNSQFRLQRVSTISGVILGDGVTHKLGTKCEGSLMGGFYATILLTGAVSSPQEQATIVFTSKSDPTKITQIPYSSTENPYLTGSDASKITFVVPHIKRIEPSYKIQTYKYNISLKIKDQGTIQCESGKSCQINFDFGRTPIVWQIFNPVSVSGMYHTQRIQFRYADDVRKQNVPLRHIAMNGFLCDYSSNELITDQTSFDRWSTRPYSCVQTFSQPILDNAAQLQTRSYSGDGYVPPNSFTYLYDGGYFTTRVLPSITSISSHSGSNQGGHLLTVKGKAWLLQQGKTKFSIDGSINCNIKSMVKDQSSGEFTATCETQATSVTSGSLFIGGQGWKQQIYTGTDSIPAVKDADPAMESNIKTLLFNSEILFNNVQVSGKYVSKSRAFFKAPLSGNYYIWHSGDDKVRVYFSKTQSTIPATWDDSTDLVVNQNYVTSLRSLWGSWDADKSKFNSRSQRIDGLTKDSYYYMQMFVSESGGSDHATIGFQIENTDPNISLRKLPQVQRIEFRSQPNLDQYKIKLYWGSDHSDPKSFELKFYNKNKDDEWETTKIQNISINQQESAFKDKVKSYFDKYFSNGQNSFVVVKTLYSNEAGNATTDVQNDALIVEFKIHMKAARDTPRQQDDKLPELKSENIDLAKSQITFTAGQPGLSGEWQLEITSPSGQVIQTGAEISNLNIQSSSWTVNYAIWNAVPEYYYKVFATKRNLVNSDPQQSFSGHEYIISYDEYRTDVPQIKAINYDMKYGANGAKTPTFDSDTIQPFSDDLFFFPAPYEFFYTPHQKPQLLVTVDSKLGACDWSSENTCDYEFTDQAPEITNISSKLLFTQLTITGTSLGSSEDEYDRIEWAGRKCSSTVSSTTIDCVITNPIAGDHLPVVNSKTNGKIKQSGLTEIEILPTLTAVSPGSIKDRGGQEITLTGTGFPDSNAVGTHTTTVTVGGVDCTNIELVSSTQLKCTTGASIPTGSQDVIVTVNGKSATKSGTTVGDLGATSATVSPTKMNATEKGTLTVTITNLAENLSDITKYDVKLVSDDHVIKMRTFQQSYPSGSNILKVKYPGGKVGDYKLVVHHADKGTLSDGSQSFRVGAKITAISVNQGSLNGGTEITITGELFHATQSIIKVGYNDCVVQGDITPSSITCITPRTRTNNNAGDLIDSSADVAVVVNLTEDAKCQVSPDCLFNWKDSVTPKVSNTAWSSNTLTISGTGFGNTKSDVKVELSQFEQQVDTVSDTEIVVTANNLKTRDGKLTLRVLVSPKGYALIPTAHYEHSNPTTLQYTGLTPSTNVSQGGQILTITGTGFPSDIVAHLTQKNSQNKLCDEVTYVSFTELTCKSNKGTINYAGTTLVVGQKTKNCGSCSIATNPSSPTLTSVSDGGYSGNDQTLNLVGSNFPTNGETVKAVIVQDTIISSSATIDSATQITAVFEGGIGFGTGLKIDSIQFSDGSFAIIDAGATIDQSLTGVAAQNINCSFAGGCLWSYTLANINRLASSLSASVCGLPCIHDQTASSDGSFQCRAPVMATKKSIQTYSNLIESKSWQNFNLQGETPIVSVYSNDPDTFGKEAFDNDVSNQTGTSQASCYLGLKIADASHVGTIDSVRYFFPRTLNAEKYVGGKFEVSNDGGSTWTSLFTIQKTPMEGWNGWDRVTGQATSGASDTFNAVRYTPQQADSTECNFMQIEIKGKVVKSETTDTVTCPVVLKRGKQTLVTQSTGIIYDESKTAKITSLSKKNISANGGQSVTITGSGFTGSVTVSIDGIDCTSVTKAADGTSISCNTGKRAAPSVKPFIVEVDNNGYAANQGNKFLYVLNWSDPDAWSGEYGPVDGDSISIPAGQNLVFDIDKGPLLKALIVEGSLLFYPSDDKTHKRTFDAEYVFVKGGLVQIGTQEDPYDSYLTITMHGTKKSAQIPIYGNKVIAVRDGGVLQMHGEAKIPSWTELYATADVGATQMELNIDNTNDDAFNWIEGDVMVLAPTDFDFRQAEQITITGVTKNASNRPVVTFTPALQYKHYAGQQTFDDGESIEMRAEVGVLTRKVVFQGDSQSQDNQYGAHIMLHSPGDESVEGRIENIQLTQVGQAFQLGRYPLHFHMIGRVTKSYIKNNAIHHTYNRACTLHGVHYLTIQGNVAYYTMGHTFFIEDAAETKNRLIRNLAIRSQASFSLLNTDQSPASFWITHPDNIFIDNHAAGAARYGFWFDMQDTAIGPSFDANICPPGERLGQFNGNVAHSNGRYGLRIFHFHIPRKFPCKPVSITPPENSANPQDDAFAQNPPIVAVYQNFTGYKNNRNAVITQKIGAVQFKNIRTADNLFAGVETTIPGFAKQDQGFLDGAVIVGFSENAGDVTRYTRAKGIIAGQKDTYTFKNVKFYNFDGNGSDNANAAIGTCSHCAHVLDNDGIANTSSFQGLSFDTVAKKIIFSSHRDAIIHDIDGSLSGAVGERWITPSQPHHQISGVCTQDSDLDTASVCTSPIRKLIFKNPVKFNEMKGQKMKIALLANVPTVPEGQDDVTWTEEMHSKFSQISQNHKKTGQWEIPFVIGQQYNVHWQYGIDWEGFAVKRSKLYQAADKGFTLRFNYTDRRDEFHVNRRNKVQNITQANAVLDFNTASNSASQSFGAHINDIPNKLWSVLINSKPDDGGLGVDSSITVSTTRCTGGCTTFAQINVEDRVRKWSVASDWQDEGDAPGSGKVPVAGEQVTVKGNWNMLYDVQSSNAVNLKKLFVNGRLTFASQADKHYEVKSEWIILQSGQLIIGQQETPYPAKATITLLGTRNQDAYAYSNDVRAGNKILFVSGKLFINGGDIIEGGDTHSKLLAQGTKGSKSLKVDSGLNWKAGHKIAIAPSGYDYKQHQLKQIESYDNATGDLTVTTALQYQHFGANSAETYQSYSYDLRTEVGHLTRNVIIQGEENERWGGQVFVTQYKNTTSQVIFAGTATLRNVQLIRMSQYDTQSAAFRTSKVQQRPVLVDRCSFHQTPAWAFNIGKSNNITLTDNVIYQTHRNAIKVHGTDTFKMTNNLFIFNEIRQFDSLKLKDHQVAVDLCTGQNANTCVNMIVQNNVVAGGKGIGFLIPSSDCDDETNSEQWFKNNRVHSVEVGVIPALNSASGSKCGLLKNFQAHHNYLIGVISFFDFSKLLLKNIRLVDNAIGVTLGIGSDIQAQIVLEDSLVIGEHKSSRDCSVSFESGGSSKLGMLSSVGVVAHSVPFEYPKLGFFALMGNAGRGKTTTIKNVVFKDFPDPSQRCKSGADTSILHVHPKASDLIMAHTFTNVKFDGVNKNSFLYLMDPPQAWANPTDCVDFPCTAPQNFLLQFRDGVTDTSSTLGLLSVPFDIVGNNPGINKGLGECSFIQEWNSSLCQRDIRALLQFESLDSDKMDRSFIPLNITNPSIPNYNNKLNSFMDHVWDGFYTGQKRLSRFISVVRTDTSDMTQIIFTGTPPLSQLFELHSAKSKTEYLLVKIDYPKPEAVRVKLGSIEKSQQDLQKGVPAALTGKVCGENRWIPQKNILEFTLLADPQECALTLVTKQSIQVTFRIEMTVAEFYSNNHQVTFVNRLAASLGIETQRIRVVGVTQGSTVIHSQIEESQNQSSDSDKIEDIQKISQKLNELASQGTALGDWKVLDYSVEVRAHQGGKIKEQIIIEQEDTDGLSIGIIAAIVIACVIVLTVIILAIVIVMHRRKPRVMFKTTQGDSVLFQKSVTQFHTEDIQPDETKVQDLDVYQMNKNDGPPNKGEIANI